MLRLLTLWTINAVALFVLPYVLDGIQIESFGTALLVALVLGLINALLRPLLILLTLPATVLSLGLFIFVINALLFQLAGALVGGFVVSGFWTAFFGSILYSLTSWALTTLLLAGGKER